MAKTIKTKSELHAGLVAFGICAAGLALPAGAQDERLTVEVGECVDLPTPAERLACFEAQVEAARQAREPAAAAPPPAAARATEPAPAARSAGAAPPPRSAEPAPVAEPAPRVVEARVRTEPQRAAQSAPVEEERRLSRREEQRAERLAMPEIVATVAELVERLPNSYLITLDNGQVWRQTVPMPYRLREGLEVRLYPSRWGDAYRLTNDGLRGYIQVERVR